MEFMLVRMQAQCEGNGQTLTRNYDASYQLMDIASPALTLHYTRDANGNVIGITEGDASATYIYDPLYRLTDTKDVIGSLLDRQMAEPWQED